jgi:desulfoferrodoxin-like iron-binding protein
VDKSRKSLTLKKRINQQPFIFFRNEKPKRKGGEVVTKVGEIYLCEICGNKVEVVAAGAGQLVCCGQPMKLVKK